MRCLYFFNEWGEPSYQIVLLNFFDEWIKQKIMIKQIINIIFCLSLGAFVLRFWRYQPIICRLFFMFHDNYTIFVWFFSIERTYHNQCFLVFFPGMEYQPSFWVFCFSGTSHHITIFVGCFFTRRWDHDTPHQHTCWTSYTHTKGERGKKRPEEWRTEGKERVMRIKNL